MWIHTSLLPKICYCFRIIINLPFRYVSDPIAGLMNVIENLSEFATVSARGIAVDADVEVLAIFWVGVSGVSHCDTLVNLGTFELEYLL